MSEHTPGPWIVVCGEKYPRAIERLNPTKARGGINNIVRWNGIGFPSSAEGHANAMLIASAPEILAALIECKRLAGRAGPSNAIDACNEIERITRTVIAKAIGIVSTSTSPSSQTTGGE